MLNGIILSVIVLNGIMLSVIILIIYFSSKFLLILPLSLKPSPPSLSLILSFYICVYQILMKELAFA
jgi:hypothetical protein